MITGIVPNEPPTKFARPPLPRCVKFPTLFTFDRIVYIGCFPFSLSFPQNDATSRIFTTVRRDYGGRSSVAGNTRLYGDFRTNDNLNPKGCFFHE